jgi:hypothetical protein
LNVLVWPVNVVDSQDGDVVVVSGVAQGQLGASLDAKVVNLLLVHIKGDGHAEEGTVGKTVVLNYATSASIISRKTPGCTATAK